MIIQLHHQLIKNGEIVLTNIQSQGEVDNHEDIKKLFAETEKTHPLPKDDGWCWVAVEEGSKYFVGTVRPRAVITKISKFLSQGPQDCK